MAADISTGCFPLELLSALWVKYFCRNVLCQRRCSFAKRVKAACILQTLVFTQKPELGYSKERMLKINHDEIEHYKASLERAGTRYQLIDTVEQDDGSIVVNVRKQYNDKADVSEYFD